MKAAGRAAAIAGAGAAILALSLWRRDIPFDVLARRYGDASSRFLTLPDGVRLHYRDVGPSDAPVLVCLHGYSASGLDWGSWAERLKDRYRLLLVDLPGHGLTAAPKTWRPGIAAMSDCVAALAEALGLQRFVVVGNSMGGQVAMTYALTHPSRIAGLVLVAAIGAADVTPDAAPSLGLRLLGSAAGRFVLSHVDLTPFVRQGLRRALGDPGLVTEKLVRQYTDFARAPGHRAILTGLQLGGRDEGLLARLAGFDKPTLVMAGDADRLVPVSQARAIAAALPASRLIVYSGIGHVPMQQDPARSSDDLIGWLASTRVLTSAAAGRLEGSAVQRAGRR